MTLSRGVRQDDLFKFFFGVPAPLTLICMKLFMLAPISSIHGNEPALLDVALKKA